MIIEQRPIPISPQLLKPCSQGGWNAGEDVNNDRDRRNHNPRAKPMISGVRTRVTVQPGGLIEIRSDELEVVQ
jgi:hypothetical protein